MKRIVTILLIHATVLCAGQADRLPAPPNSAYVRDNLFMDKTEIANIHWLEFLSSVRLDSGEAYYQAMLPDTTVWLELDSAGSSYHFYLSNWLLRFYPVVGISHRQAVQYCVWRTAVVNRRLQNDPKYAGIRYRFRLPAEEEWEQAASAGLNTDGYPYGYRNYESKTTMIDDYKFYWEQIVGKTVLTEKEFRKLFTNYTKRGVEPFFNCMKNFLGLFTYGANQPISIFDLTNKPEMKYRRMHFYESNATANPLGLSHMIGNVAEMVAEEGISKGGSWKHPLEECQIRKSVPYTKPGNWLGFRCAAEVLYE
jgi:formylglycine-generating enzyme required for sulfatase activity